jgi:phage tail-like protein
MAEFRERPYSQFNFLVEISGGPGSTDTKAGFQEVSGLGMEVANTEYRNGNENDNAPRKMAGLYKVADVTLKRGVIGDIETLFGWIKSLRESGVGKEDNLRTVTISLQNESHQEVQKWILTNARPIKYTGPSFNGKGSEIAMEELVLACERIDVE